MYKFVEMITVWKVESKYPTYRVLRNQNEIDDLNKELKSQYPRFIVVENEPFSKDYEYVIGMFGYNLWSHTKCDVHKKTQDDYIIRTYDYGEYNYWRVMENLPNGLIEIKNVFTGKLSVIHRKMLRGCMRLSTE